MRTEISKLSFDESHHFLGVFHQMGRMPLDSEINEQNELVLRIAQRIAGDAIHTGSPNEGFRVDTRVLLDKLESRASWSTTPPGATLFVDYFDHRVGDGSLVVHGATAAARTLAQPRDLRGLSEVLVAVKGVFAAGQCRFYLRDGATQHVFNTVEIATESGWKILRATPGALPAGFALDNVVEYGFTGLDPAARYNFDYLKIDVPLRTLLVRTDLPHHYTVAGTGATLALDDDRRLWNETSLVVSAATSVGYALPAPRDLSRARRLIVALQRTPAAASVDVELIDGAAQALTLAGPVTSSATAGFEILAFDLPQAGPFDWTTVAQVRWRGLDAAAEYVLGGVWTEADPARDLVIMGGEGAGAAAGRFYGDGLAAIKETHGSYTTQGDLPEPDPSALAPVAAGSTRVDWAYLDLWERPVTYIEQPVVREVALEGRDTATRTQLIAQVRLLKGQEVAVGTEPPPPAMEFAALPHTGRGTLTTKDTPQAALDPCADPCEPEIAGPYLGDDNRLFRIEIHRGGDIGVADAAGTAIYKWSPENAAIAAALTANAPAGATSVLVEKPELFAVGDLIELADDLVELVTGPYEDRVQHRLHERGELRRVVTVNLQTARVSWEDPAAAEPGFHAPLPRAMRLAYHAKITKWGGVGFVTAGDIVLADGVTIEFGGAGFVPADFWLFTTRVVDRSVERLLEAPPRGVRHAHHLLASITRSRADAATPESIIVADLRPRFVPLPRLDASRVSFDGGACEALEGAGWADVGTVQEAIEALCRADQSADLRLHNRLLHGYGVVCGLKLRCSANRANVILGGGYALDCQGWTIHVRGDRMIDLLNQASAQGLLDGTSSGHVALTISRSATQDAEIALEPYVKQSFWDEVLEGTLLKDFLDDCILSLFNFLKAQLLPFPDQTLPLSDQHRRVISLINLFFQWFNGASGPYIFLSKAEHDLLEQFYADLRDKIASKTYCGMFDGLQQFPAYPYPAQPGIDTMFGLFNFASRMRMHAAGRHVYAFGGTNRIQVFELASRSLVEVLDFPGGTNVDVQDVAFNAAGTEMYVVGIMSNSDDSVFATVTIGAGQTHAWGPTTVVCDIKFVRLGTHARFPTTLYAIGRSPATPAKRGLYTLVVNAISLAPAPALPFAATGMLELDPNTNFAYAAENSLGGDTDNFDRVRSINLASLGAAPINFIVAGNETADDMKIMDGRLFVTGQPAPGHTKSLHRFNTTSPAPLGAVDLLVATPTRLGPLPARNTVLVSYADRYMLRGFNAATGTLVTSARLPVQIIPYAINVDAGQSTACVLNVFSNTVSVLDIATLLAGPPPSFTFEPPATLATYRGQAIKAFTDLLSVIAQSLKDCFCDKFLVECTECTEKDKIYLGVVEIKNRQVHHICNFSKRHYVKSFRTWGYWLSTVPILPAIKKSFAAFCCKII